MSRHITSSQTLHARRSIRPALPAPRHVCAECQRGGISLPLYAMNGQSYCEPCLQTWSLSLPEVQADLLTWSMSEQNR